MRAERSEFPYLFYYRIIKGRCKVWAGQGANFLPGGGRGKQKRPPRHEHKYLGGSDQYAVFLNSNQAQTAIEGSGRSGKLLLIKDSYGNTFAQFPVEDYYLPKTRAADPASSGYSTDVHGFGPRDFAQLVF